MEDVVSIIVPVYNISTYIRQCIDSVINQTYQDWELILIDDGSLDDCSTICDDYAAKDIRIKVIHQENAGSSAARNTGIKASSGKWIMFLDGDDWIESNTLENCIEAARQFNADFIKFGLYYQYDESFKRIKLHPFYEEKDLFLKDLIARKISLSIWAGLYRRSLFDNLTPIFPEGLNFGEDYSVITRLLYYSEKFYVLNKALYNYRIRANGYVKSAKWNNAQQLIGCEEIVYDFFIGKNNGLYNKALFQGRANVKAYCYSLILNDYTKNKIHYNKIKSLYAKTISLENASRDTRLLFFIMHNSFTLSIFRFLWSLRKLSSNILKARLKII